MLTDPFTPRMFAELLDLEIEQAKLIYQVYGVSNQDYRPVFGDVADYEVPLLDLLLFLFDLGESGRIVDAAMGEIHALRGTLERALAQLRGETWSRMVITAAVPEEGERSVGLVEQIREAARCVLRNGSGAGRGGHHQRQGPADLVQQRYAEDQCPDDFVCLCHPAVYLPLAGRRGCC